MVVGKQWYQVVETRRRLRGGCPRACATVEDTVIFEADGGQLDELGGSRRNNVYVFTTWVEKKLPRGRCARGIARCGAPGKVVWHSWLFPSCGHTSKTFVSSQFARSCNSPEQPKLKDSLFRRLQALLFAPNLAAPRTTAPKDAS